MNIRIKKSAGLPAVERITNVAAELFYKQGYRATGINEVISKSGVAKATFYNHFPSKDDLGLACLKKLSDGELAYIDNAIATAKGELDRFLSVIESLGPWLIDTKFRGCGFINIASEIPDYSSPLRKVGTKLYDGIRQRVEMLCQELIDSNPEKYGHLDQKNLSNEYMVVFVGAVALAELYHDIWPVTHALKTMRRLMGENAE